MKLYSMSCFPYFAMYSLWLVFKKVFWFQVVKRAIKVLVCVTRACGLFVLSFCNFFGKGSMFFYFV